jgi:hypothetical protein
MVHKIHFDYEPIPTNISAYVRHEKTTLDDCDFIISSIPINTQHYFSIQALINMYINVPKKVYIFLITDICEAFVIPKNVYLYRTCLCKTPNKFNITNEKILPWVWDGTKRPFTSLPKKDKPIVGFCGLQSKYRHELLRQVAINNNIIDNFIIKETTLIKEYEENILSSHFTICNRGAGNFDIRFYQTIALGRIPILLNTDTILPFEDEINWNEIIIMKDTEEEIIKTLLEWWETKDIEDIQYKCKEIYDRYFQPEQYFEKIFYGN